MLNYTVLVGRLVDDPQLKELENGKKIINIKLAVPRDYKNSEGKYDTDFIKCTMLGDSFNSVKDYLQKGDLVGVKGRLQTYYNKKDENINEKITIRVEKISFLSKAKSVGRESEKEEEIER